MAAKLVACLGLEPAALDALRYDATGERVARDVLIAATARIAAREAWLAEGMYLAWTLPLIEAADLIVWVDTPRVVAARRVLRRAARLRTRSGAPYGRRKTLRLAASALRPRTLDQVLASPKNLNPSPAAIEAVLTGHRSKTIRVRGRRDPRLLIGALSAAPTVRADRP